MITTLPYAASPAIATSTTLPSRRQTSAGEPAKTAGTVSISQAARNALAAASSPSSANSIDARLAEIKSKDALSRTQEETDYVLAHDARFAAIRDKMKGGNGPDTLTADDLDYMQKAGGFVNTMAMLSPAEKTLYDKMVASGDKAAAAGMSQIALIRTMGHVAGGANGTTYDPINTEITVANIERYFSHSIVDPTGKAQSQFQALIQYLQSNPATA
ncbi:MAG: hypothetical protein ABFC42_11940 [Sulfuricella sp.]